MEPLLPEEARQVLVQCRTATLGLAANGNAYAIPLHFVYDGRYIYFHSHPGEKERFIAATREACLAVVRVEGDDIWESVLVFGPVERLHVADDILAAMHAMMTCPPPPEWGLTKTHEPKRSSRNMFFWRLRPERITGRKSARPIPAEDRWIT